MVTHGEWYTLKIQEKIEGEKLITTPQNLHAII